MKKYPISDPRLLAVADYVGKGGVVADIGTDHGHLVCYLVTHDICRAGYACDIGEMPLTKAAALVCELGLEGSIKTVLTNGLQGLPMEEITDIVIAGMGGELIANILTDSPIAHNSKYTFILQPMTKAERLRRFLALAGFCIEEERGVQAGGFVYPVMCVTYTGKPFQPDALYCWTGRLPDSPHPDSRLMLEKVRASLLETAEGLERSRMQQEGAGEYRALAQQIGLTTDKEVLE